MRQNTIHICLFCIHLLTSGHILAQADSTINTPPIPVPPEVEKLLPPIEKVTLQSGVFKINNPASKNVWTVRQISLDIQTKPPLVIPLNPGGTFRVPFLRDRIIPWQFAFQPGDTLVVAAQARGKNPMRYARIKDQNKSLIKTCAKCVLLADTLAVNTPQTFWLHLRSAPSLFKQYTDVTAKVIRPQTSDSLYHITDTVFQTVYTEHFDTILLTIANDSLQIDPVWNIEGRRAACIKLEIPGVLPKGEKLAMAAYWFGIGRKTQDQYLQLEQSIPPDWVRPGAPPALAAYLLNKAVSLPPNSPDENIYMAFVLENDRSWVETGKKARKPLFGITLSNNFGRISNKTLASQLPNGKKGYYSPCYACFYNRHTVNGVFVSLKMTAYYLKPLPQTSQTNILAIRKSVMSASK